MSKKKVVVIGAGFGGLASASLLAKDGFDVTLLEKLDQPGGRARVWEKDGFLFDMGPSWYLMPEVFENFFSQFGKKASDFYQLKRLDPNYRIFFGKEPPVDIPADPQQLAPLLEKLEPGAGEKLETYLQAAKFQYETAMGSFMYRNYRSLTDFFSWELITKGLKLHLFEGLDKFARRYFQDHRIRKLLEYTVVFLGGSPNNTPALYAIMSHVDFSLGVWYPLGGLSAVVKAYEKIAVEAGVRILYNQEVRRIESEKGEARRVVTNQGVFPADIVLSNADYHHTESKLLKKEDRSYSERYWNSRKIGPSGFIIYLGLKKKVKNLLHHNLYLDSSWDDHFRSIFDRPAWPQNPSYYVSCPAKTDPAAAPADGENLFFLVPVAPGLPDNNEIRERYLEKTIRHLEKTIGENIRDSIVVRRTFAHNDFSRDYHSFQGTALGLSHTLFQTAVFRPAVESKKLKNLYYAGNYTHPGIGVPMVTIAAQNVAGLISQRHGN